MRASRKHRYTSRPGLIVPLVLGMSVAVGCSFDSSGVDRDGGGGETPALCDTSPWELTPAHFDPCAIPEPVGELILAEAGQYTYSTTTGELTPPRGEVSKPLSMNLPQAGGPEVRLISVERFELVEAATLRVIGEHPLIIASWDAVTVDGTIDVGSRWLEATDGSHVGAGANPDMACMAGAGGDGVDASGSGGGGGGGGFGAVGGTGGSGGSGGGAGGAGGAMLGAPPALLRGGCAGGRGGKGGNADEEDGSGVGGDGGGAIQLAARMSITINGNVGAAGAGGRGATADLSGDETSERAGGGGGGSGGMISFEAPTVDVGSEAALAANGGGGGGGVDKGVGEPGDDGGLGAATAFGGRSDGQGGTGGFGGALNPEDGGLGGSASRGGGGGGGGIGVIVIKGTTRTVLSGSISPQPTQQ